MIDLILVILAVASVILYVVTVISIVGDTRKRKNYSECTGVIQNIWKRRRPGDEPGRYIVSPIIIYTVNGMNYKVVGDCYSTKMQVGQRIQMLYDRAAPSKAVVKKTLYVTPLITGLVGAAFTFAFVFIVLLRSIGIITI